MAEMEKKGIHEKVKRPKRIMVRLTDKEYNRLKQLSELAQKKTMASYIRESALNENEKYLKAISLFKQFLAEILIK